MAQREAMQRLKSDCENLAPWLLIRQTIDAIKFPTLKTPQQISLKFGLNSFQVRVVFPPIFGLCLVSEEKWKTKKKQKKQSENIRHHRG